MKVVERGRYAIYVYREVGQPHSLPHCNIRWADGNTQVALDSGDRLVGTPLPKQARRLVHENIDALRAAWNNLNPELPA